MPPRTPGSARKKGGDADEWAPQCSERGRGKSADRRALPRSERGNGEGARANCGGAGRATGQCARCSEGWEAGPPTAQGQG